MHERTVRSAALIADFTYVKERIMVDKLTTRVDAYTIDGDRFKVLMNDEEQYSIWPEQKAVPAGWHDKGFAGTKAEVTQYIDQHWTDMRPASLRKAMAASAKQV